MGRNSKRLSSTSVDEEEEQRSSKRQSIEHDEPSDEDQSNAASDDNYGDENADPEAEDEEDEQSPTPTDRERSDPAINAGIIKKVYVENFMCHRKFTVDFCRNVNFITGQNGSGKSAILAALQICLGAGARNTHRAGNLKDLIRKDGAANQPTEAIIRVSLMNEGSDAYEPERYGKTITVERTITKNGGFNGFKLLDEKSTEVSRKKKDLLTMLDYLNIQVENPVAVLDQENAKKFLCGSGEEKFLFFKKATDLARIDATYAATQEKLEELTLSVERMNSTLSQKKLVVDEARQKVKQHKEIDELKAKLQGIEMMYAWSFHKVAAKEHWDAEQVVAKYEAKVKEREDELAEFEKAFSQDSTTDEETKRRRVMDDLIQQVQELTDKKQQLESQFRQQMVPIKQLEKEKQMLRKDRKEIEQQLHRAQQRLNEMRKQISERSGSKEAEHLKALNEAENELQQLKKENPEIKQAVSTSLRAYEELTNHVRDASSRVDTIQRQLGGIGGRIRNLQAASADSLSMLGPNVKKVHDAIQRHVSSGKFRGPVIGPIAHYIKVAAGKEKYAAIAEKALGRGMLDRFIATTDEDRRILQNIRKDAGCKSDCGIVQTKNTARFSVMPFDIEGVERVCSVLNVEDDLVFNTLVDNANIDRVALCDDKASSENLLYYVQDGRDAIRGPIQEVFYLPNGGKWTVKGGNKADILDGQALRQTLGVDKSELVAQAREEEMQLKKELQEARAEHNKLEHEHTELQRQWNQHKRHLRTNTENSERLMNEISELKDQIEASANVEIDTNDQEQEIQELEREIEELDLKDGKFKEEIRNLMQGVEYVKASINECSERIDTVLEESKAAEEHLTQFLQNRTQHEDQLERKRQKLDKYRAAVDTSREKMESLKKDTLAALRQARLLAFQHQRASQNLEDMAEGEVDISDEPSEDDLESIEPPDESDIREPSHYEAKMNKMRSRIEKEKQKRNISRDDRATAYEKYQRALEDFLNQQQLVDEVESKIKVLNKDLRRRIYARGDMQEFLEKFTDLKFKELLLLNHFHGGVTFDHEKESLDLQVSKSSDKKAASKDVKNLSGGEKSYTQMCLILALGEKLETPFRVLDEFDVFLDAPTRKLTIKMLIHLALEKMSHRQFIFITPQDISDIASDPRLKILRMLPPKRHGIVGGPSQQTLNFSQAS
ncbi:hypothetical protein FisN_7Hh114 [Fistulifera solaris]|uniref:Rad50/SbcC-type AAA domain-containing protein n=1 Tax=Fistulifera solaris TaxID=1519565 RepID=A0A1Z5K3Z8_FISSO|nr:hypothetical protein FisN_7Hh114 [Fistulifera solaris]|eukprot:GAX20801.1 hypothetical protein FisN_7Hh114 [Fistulifera solaris]